MRQCLKITFSGNCPEGFLRDFVQKNARQCNLEGTGQYSNDFVRIIICGEKEQIDTFLDLLHKDTKEIAPEGFEIEPFVRDKDYRGVFRVIE